MQGNLKYNSYLVTFVTSLMFEIYCSRLFELYYFRLHLTASWVNFLVGWRHGPEVSSLYGCLVRHKSRNCVIIPKLLLRARHKRGTMMVVNHEWQKCIRICEFEKFAARQKSNYWIWIEFSLKYATISIRRLLNLIMHKFSPPCGESC